MSEMLLTLASAAVRGWTRVYTWRLPAAIGERRRAEVASDLWELEHDPWAGSRLSRTAQILGRLAAGIPDDVGWWAGQIEILDSLAGRRFVAVTAAMVLIAALLAAPALLAGSAPRGRARVQDCVIALPVPETTADLRETIITCAGAFFSPLDGRTP